MKTSSCYEAKVEDRYALYLVPGEGKVQGDGIADDTKGIQEAIREVKERYGFGIVFLAEGTYRITDTIYMPKAVRLIGYGANRPKIVLADNAPGFDREVLEDKGKSKYMMWFVDSIPKEGEEVRDANPGTFYSAISNVDFVIGKGNTHAIALRTHYAQHSFVNHIHIDATYGKAGMYDMGNEMEDVQIVGGEYGIITTKCSPGWPFVMVDTFFTGQKKAAIYSAEGGLTIVRMTVRNVPTVIELAKGCSDKLYMEDCLLENISDVALIITMENNTVNQINMKNVSCNEVPNLVYLTTSKEMITGKGSHYLVKSFTRGLQILDLQEHPIMITTKDIVPIEKNLEPVTTNIPKLPTVDEWVNVQTLGAKGDGKTDDTKCIQDAIEKYEVIYFPQGWYHVSDTLILKENTKLIGLNPISTQLILPDNTEAFAGLNAPKALVETPEGGENIINGIGIDSGARNSRAVGVKWMAGEYSYMNDVKFIGGHGTMHWGEQGWSPVYNANRTGDINPDRLWDKTMWSLWITNGGGGVFKDIWSANTYAAAGLYVSDTQTPSAMYCISLEHHVRTEARFKRVENFKIYGLQTEEEVAEGPKAQPLELEECRNMLFANLYMFRVVWVATAFPHCIRAIDCENMEFCNVHNFSQTKYTIDNLLLDVNSGIEIRPWEIARLLFSSVKEKAERKEYKNVIKLYDGFDYADGCCSDSKGNFYFVDAKLCRIYCIDGQTKKLSLLADLPFIPNCLAVDAKDNLLVAAEYFYPKDATKDGKLVETKLPKDALGCSYFYYYSTRSVLQMYSIDPKNPESTLTPLEKKKKEEVITDKKVPTAFYFAGSRWRDFGDCKEMLLMDSEEYFVAPDGETVIPIQMDLMRTSYLTKAKPGKDYYTVDELYKRVYRVSLDDKGTPVATKALIEYGDYCVREGKEDLLFVGDCHIKIFDKKGNFLKEIEIPERPTSFVFAGKDKQEIFIATRHGIYCII